MVLNIKYNKCNAFKFYFIILKIGGGEGDLYLDFMVDTLKP